MENQLTDNITQTDRNRYLLFISVLWCYNIILQYVRGALLGFVKTPESSHAIINTGVVLSLLIALKYIFIKIKTSDILFVFTVITIFILSKYLFIDNLFYFKESQTDFLLTVLPMYFIGITICLDKHNFKILYKYLYYLSLVTVILFSIYSLFINTDNADTYRDGDMNAAYNILPHICMVFSSVVKKPKLLNTMVFILGVFMLFSMGTRGAIVCLGVYVLLCLIFITAINKPLLTVAMFGIGYVLLFSFGLYEKILFLLYSFANSFGLSTRFFDKLLSGQISQSNSRVIIRERVLEALFKHPFTGLGIYGDRVAAGNTYAHNFFIEILAQFGVIIGVVLIGLFLYLILKAFRKLVKTKRTDILSIFFVCIVSGFLKLFLSDSYIDNPFFFLLIGLSCNIIRNELLFTNEFENDDGYEIFEN